MDWAPDDRGYRPLLQTGPGIGPWYWAKPATKKPCTRTAPSADQHPAHSCTCQPSPAKRQYSRRPSSSTVGGQARAPPRNITSCPEERTFRNSSIRAQRPFCEGLMPGSCAVSLHRATYCTIFLHQRSQEVIHTCHIKGAMMRCVALGLQAHACKHARWSSC
jgi:hypothetical protein